MRECLCTRSNPANARQTLARSKLRLGCRQTSTARQVDRASTNLVPWVELARSGHAHISQSPSRQPHAGKLPNSGQLSCAASSRQQSKVSEARDTAGGKHEDDAPKKVAIKAMSMPKKGQLRVTAKVTQEQTPGKASAAKGAARAQTTMGKASSTAMTPSYGGMGKGLGQYERRRRIAEAAGAPQDAVIQYEDTADAQHQAALRAAEMHKRQKQDAVQQFSKQRYDAMQSGISRAQPSRATEQDYGQDDVPEFQRVVNMAGKELILKKLLPNFNQETLNHFSKQVQDRLGPAIDMERTEAEAAVRDLYKKKPTKELAESGMVLLDMQPTAVGELLGDIIWAFKPATETASSGPVPAGNRGSTPQQPKAKAASKTNMPPIRRFKEGETVYISDMSLSQNSKMSKAERLASEDAVLTGTILKMLPTHVKIVLTPGESDRLRSLLRKDDMKGMRAPSFRLDRALIEVTAQRQMTALEKLSSLQGFDYAMKTAFRGGEVELKQRIQGELNLRLMLLVPDKFASTAQSPPLWASGGPEGVEEGHRWQNEIRHRLDSFTGLNQSQKLAVATAICRKLTLWQGPPGTGKTRSLLAYIELMVTSKPARPITPLLACTDTNAAVDNIVEGLVKRGIKVVRLGQPAKVREDLRHVCLEALAANTPKGRQATQLKEEAASMLERAQKGGEAWRGLSLEDAENLTWQAKEMQKKAKALVHQASDDVLAQAEVVASTCTSSGDEHRLHGKAFRLVVLDEATQATEPSSLIPLIRGAESVVIAGDPKQLPPTVVSQAAVNLGLQVTLFDRLQEAGVEPLLLDTQYRMHPRIAEVPSELFYKNRLKSGVTPEERPLPMGFPWSNPAAPVALVPCDHGREVQGEASRSSLLWQQGASASDSGGASYKNPEEAALAIQVAQLMLSGEDISSLAILTPYNGQVRELQSRSHSLLRSSAAREISIDISSVDAYQGREADVIIITTVRCNKQGRIGFVADPRRFNVAISRPRRGLVIVGSPNTLFADPVWRRWLSWVRQQGCISSAGSVQHAMDDIQSL